MASTEIERTHITPPTIAAELGTSVDTVLGLIRSGQLKASNLGQRVRPRWRVSRADLQAFLDARSNQRPKPAPRRRRQPEAVPQYV